MIDAYCELVFDGVAANISNLRNCCGLYVLELSSSVVKVGRSNNLQSRLTTHLATARSYGVDVLRAAVVRLATKDALSGAEKEMLLNCSSRGVSVGPESFTGLGFDTACDVALNAVANSTQSKVRKVIAQRSDPEASQVEPEILRMALEPRCTIRTLLDTLPSRYERSAVTRAIDRLKHRGQLEVEAGTVRIPGVYV